MGDCDCWCHAPIDDEGCSRCRGAHVEGSGPPIPPARSFSRDYIVLLRITGEAVGQVDWSTYDTKVANVVEFSTAREAIDAGVDAALNGSVSEFYIKGWPSGGNE